MRDHFKRIVLSPADESITFKLSEEEKIAIAEKAKREGVSMSRYIRVVLAEDVGSSSK